MRIEGIDNTGPIRPVRGPGIGRHLGESAQRGQASGAEAPSGPPVEDAPLETYSLRDVQPAVARPDDGPAKFASSDQTVKMFAKLSGLWDTFREMGVFPPPKSYNGFKVVTPTEVMLPDASSPEGERGGGLSAADEAAITMVEHLLRRFVTESEASDESARVEADAQLQATTSDGQRVGLRAHAELTAEARTAGGRFGPPPGEAMEVFLSQAGPLPEGPLELEIDVDPEPADRPDGESVGRAVSVWGRDEQGEKRLLAFGREGQGAVYVGHQDTPEPQVASSPDSSPAEQAHRSGLSPYEQAALGQLGNLDLAV